MGDNIELLLANPNASVLKLGRALRSYLGTWSDDEALAVLWKQAAGTRLADRLASIAAELLLPVLRSGAGLPASPHAVFVAEWLDANSARWSGIFAPDARNWSRVLMDLSGEHAAIATASAQQNREAAQRLYDDLMIKADAELAIGAWMEQRSIYSTDNYLSSLIVGARRDHHLGLDLFAPAKTPVYMPMPGTIAQTGIIDERLDYGGFIVTRHEVAPDAHFFALWGHVSHGSAHQWKIGERVAEGTELARIGEFEENGWWLPHLHLQLSALEFSDFRTMPGVGESACLNLWAELFPNPTSLVLGR